MPTRRRLDVLLAASKMTSDGVSVRPALEDNSGQVVLCSLENVEGRHRCTEQQCIYSVIRPRGSLVSKQRKWQRVRVSKSYALGTSSGVAVETQVQFAISWTWLEIMRISAYLRRLSLLNIQVTQATEELRLSCSAPSHQSYRHFRVSISDDPSSSLRHPSCNVDLCQIFL